MATYRLHRLILFLATATTAVALAHAQQPDQGQKPAAQSTPPATQPATSQATPKAAAQSKPAKATAPTKKGVDSDAQLIKDARNAGFRPITIRGVQMFCRTAVELGSSFPVRTCYDSDQVKIKIHEYAEERSQLEQMRSVGQPPM